MTSVIKLDCDTEIRTELQLLLSRYGSSRSALKSILHDLQNKHHGISNEHIQVLADMLNIHAVEIEEVVSFYNFYNIGKKANILSVCVKRCPVKWWELKK